VQLFGFARAAERGHLIAPGTNRRHDLRELSVVGFNGRRARRNEATGAKGGAVLADSGELGGEERCHSAA